MKNWQQALLVAGVGLLVLALAAGQGQNFPGDGGGGGFQGVTAKTANYTATAGDNGKLITMNGASLTLTLPNPPPSNTWAVEIEDLNSTSLTVSPNGLTLNGSTANVLNYQNAILSIYTDGANYFTNFTSGTTVFSIPNNFNQVNQSNDAFGMSWGKPGTGQSFLFNNTVGAAADFGPNVSGTQSHWMTTGTPTISSGFGTSPCTGLTASAGTCTGTALTGASFQLSVGGGGTATSGVIGLPSTVTTGHVYNCFVSDQTTASNYTRQTASTATTATLSNFNSAGTATAWAANDVLIVACLGD